MLFACVECLLCLIGLWFVGLCCLFGFILLLAWFVWLYLLFASFVCGFVLCLMVLVCLCCLLLIVWLVAFSVVVCCTVVLVFGLFLVVYLVFDVFGLLVYLLCYCCLLAAIYLCLLVLGKLILFMLGGGGFGLCFRLVVFILFICLCGL